MMSISRANAGFMDISGAPLYYEVGGAGPPPGLCQGGGGVTRSSCSMRALRTAACSTTRSPP